MTARLATHPELGARALQLREALIAYGVDVEFAPESATATPTRDLLPMLSDGAIDLALVPGSALRRSATHGLTTVAVLPREEPRDVLVVSGASSVPLRSLPQGSRVGVARRRRRSLLLAHRPDVEVVSLENWISAADALANGTVDAVVLAAIEARRTGLSARASEILDPRAWAPCPGQGTFALVARHPIAEATALDHVPTRTALRAELELLEALGAPVDAPIGALAQPSGRWIRLWAAAAGQDGRALVRSDLTGPLDEPEELGRAVARQLLDRGVATVLAEVAE